MSSMSPRVAQIIERLREITHDLSGFELSDLVPTSTFLELGFDSLFLTQLGTAYQREYGVKVTFRQLFDELPTMSAIAAYIEGNLPAAEAAAATPLATAAPPESMTPPTSPPPPMSQPPVLDGTRNDPAPPPVQRKITLPQSTAVLASGSAMQSLFLQQLQLMNEQIRLLREIGQADQISMGTSAQSGAVTHGQIPVSNSTANDVASPELTPGETTARSTTAVATEPPRSADSKLPSGFVPAASDGQRLAPLPPRQQQHLDALIARYTRKTAGSKQRTQANRGPLADPRTAAGFNRRWKEMVYPIWVERSFGSRLWDVDGNEYIDILNGFGANFLGHSPEFVTRAIAAQLERGVEIGPQTPLVGEVARLICDFTGMDRASFMCTGSEAVQAAKRIARTYTGRDKVVVFAGDYHGNFDQVLVRSANRPDRLRTMPMAPGIPNASVEETWVLEYGAEQSLDWIRRYADQIAAVLVEPIQSRRPDLQPREFLHELRRITEQAGILLVFDEVITGFRVEPGGAQAYFGVQADLATYGKVIGGGMPIGVVAGRARFMDTLDGGPWRFGDESFPEAGVTFFAGTFVRHPLAIVAAHASLTYLREQGPALQARVNAATKRFAGALTELFRANHLHIEIPHFSSQMYLKVKEDAELAPLLFYHLRQRGVHLAEGFPCYLTAAHTDEDVDFLIDAFQDSIAEMTEAGIFGGRESAAAAPRQFPLTSAQREIWFASQLSPKAACAYNESDTLELNGPLDVDKLQNAVREIFARHEALHLRFADDAEFQSVAADREVKIRFVDLTDREPADQAAAFEQLIGQEASTPFDLKQGPLFRVTLVCYRSDRHALIVYGNHLVFDGWSSGVLFREIAQHYSAAITGQPTQLPPPARFSDYAALEAAAEANGDRERSRKHWLGQFSGPPPVMNLPTDRPRQAHRSFVGGTVKWRLDDQIYRAVKSAAAAQNTSLNAWMLAAFKTLLARLSGQDEFVIGVSVAGQAMVEFAPLVGHGVNLIPLRTRLTKTGSFAELLKQTKSDVLDLHEYYQCTLGDILREVSWMRDPARAPLVEVLFNFSTHSSRLQFAELQTRIGENPRRFVNFDLFANLLESDGGLTADWDYNAALFDEATVRRWIGHFETLLSNAAESCESAWVQLDILSPEERQKIVHQWNDTETPFPRDTCLHDFISAQAARTPQQVAVVQYRGRAEVARLTYRQLEQRANQLAQCLQTKGIGPGHLVAICLDRTDAMVIGLLAVLKAGAAYVPIDPGYPSERIAWMLQDSGAQTVLVDSIGTAAIPAGPWALVDLERDAAEIFRGAAEPVSAEVKPVDTAYVIYTSGSTGKPKGVRVPHRALVNFLASMARAPGLAADDRLLAVTTICFDIAGLEIYLPLWVGARCILVDEKTTSDGRMLGEVLNLAGATAMQATPMTWRLLIEAGWTERRIKVMCGGEALCRNLADELLRRSDQVWNMYGPTETTIWSACHRLAPDETRVVIGRPIANTQIYILDSMGQPVPPGVVGQLYIAGEGLAEGYHQRDELTRERFVHNPYGLGASSRMYRTGDLARYLPDGAIECLGRIDNQIKLRGFRIELGEIESLLMERPEIEQAVVALWDRTADDQRLVAYVTAADPTSVNPADVIGALRKKLADYMVPQHLVMVDQFLRTPNGKIDRSALPPPNLKSDANAGVPDSEMTPIEKRVATLWADVLQVDAIRLDDDFFYLGGHSLIAARMLRRATNEFGVELSLRNFFDAPTVRGLAELIAAQQYCQAALDVSPHTAPIEEVSI